jgi:MoaA/NifB/PqqE/SkfB family radical SAM enzyme
VTSLARTLPPLAESYPESPLLALDTLWFQVAGSLCNLQCTHCFISCSPTNAVHAMLDLPTVRRWLAEAAALGVREYYFTGGEPFLNRELFEMIEATLQQGPVTVLTNGVLITRHLAERLSTLERSSDYSLDLRVSLDGWDAAGNDAIRGAGTFTRILTGIRHLSAAGLSPIVTVTGACDGALAADGRARLLALLAEIGLPHPRLKVIPLLRLGAEEKRGRAYVPAETLRGLSLTREDTAALQCSSSRMVTARGVYVCPILIDSPGARLSDTLAGALRPFTLSYSACHTCHAEGLSCRT